MNKNVAISILTTKKKNIPDRVELIKQLQDINCKVFYIGTREKSEINDYYKTNNVDFIETNVKRVQFNPFREFLNSLNITKELKHKKLDSILIYGVRTFPLMVFSAKRAKIKNIVCVVNGSGRLFTITGIKGKLLRFVSFPMLRRSLKNTAHVFFQNNDDLNLFKEKKMLKKSNYSLINGSGVNVEDFQFQELPKKNVFTMISRLTLEKGVLEYLEAATKVKETYPETTFLLAGPLDDSRINLEDIKNLQNKGIVEYYGKTDNIKEILKNTKVFVLPSFYPEGVPRTNLEALAVGRPIITSNSPGCKETVINNHNGFLVEPNNSADLVEKMISMINLTDSKIKTMSENSRILAEKKFNVILVNQEIIKFLCSNKN